MKRKPSHSSKGGSVKRAKIGEEDEEQLHYTKSGELDMRYNSSKRYQSSCNASASAATNSATKKHVHFGSPSRGHSVPLPFGGTPCETTVSRTRNPRQTVSGAMPTMKPPASTCIPLSSSQRIKTRNNTRREDLVGTSHCDHEEEELHYTKSGKLDMRYSASKRFIEKQKLKLNASCIASTGNVNPTKSILKHRAHSLPTPVLNETSVENVGSVEQAAVRALAKHFPETHAPEQKFQSQQQIPQAESVEHQYQLRSSVRTPPEETEPTGKTHLLVIHNDIPSDIPVTKTNLPDLRTKAARDWIKSQAEEHGRFNAVVIPSWIPRQKDGTVDLNKGAVQLYLDTKGQHTAVVPAYDGNRRMKYYQNKLKNKHSNFYRFLMQVRAETVAELPYVLMDNNEIINSFQNEDGVPGTDLRPEYITNNGDSDEDDDDFKIPTYIPMLDYETLMCTIGDKQKNKLGNGAFGIVYKGYHQGQDVAVKKLFLDPISSGDKQSFLTELKILASFGDHPNLVKLFGYSMEPATLVMEYVKLGSLSHLLYYCDDDMVEARLCDGRIKKRIVSGIVNGMRQLHSVSIIHGDLKPANILITDDYSAKIADFGLARLRGKTSSLIASNMREDGENVVAGTAAYMAPELLDTSNPVDFSSDVYAFGVVLNEIVHEEEPYSQDYEKIRGRGPFGAVHFAKSGHRPSINLKLVADNLFMLIISCWNSFPKQRPTFDIIAAQTKSKDLAFPSLVNFPSAGTS